MSLLASNTNPLVVIVVVVLCSFCCCCFVFLLLLLFCVCFVVVVFCLFCFCCFLFVLFLFRLLLYFETSNFHVYVSLMFSKPMLSFLLFSTDHPLVVVNISSYYTVIILTFRCLYHCCCFTYSFPLLLRQSFVDSKLHQCCINYCFQKCTFKKINLILLLYLKSNVAFHVAISIIHYILLLLFYFVDIFRLENLLLATFFSTNVAAWLMHNLAFFLF